MIQPWTGCCNQSGAGRITQATGTMSRTVLFFFLSALTLLAAPQDPFAELGFQHFYNLEYDQAIEVFGRKAAANPDDPAAQVHLAQSILFQAMFTNGALESDLISASDPFVSRPKLPVTGQQKSGFEAAIQRAITLTQLKVQANGRDVRALYMLGAALGLRANWNYLVYKSWLDPLRDATQARKLHNQVTEIDPNFHDARLVQGVHDYLVSSLPLTVKMLGVLAGFRGDREEGMRLLRLVYDKGSTNRMNAAVILAAILRREKRQKEAIPLLEEVTTKFPRNYLFRYELALLYADLGNRQKAMQQIDVIEKLRAKVPLSVERLEYMRGSALMQAWDFDGAVAALAKRQRRPITWKPNVGRAGVAYATGRRSACKGPPGRRR
jgi:tetratricopeptide (TPR) repeat protein